MGGWGGRTGFVDGGGVGGDGVDAGHLEEHLDCCGEDDAVESALGAHLDERCEGDVLCEFEGELDVADVGCDGRGVGGDFVDCREDLFGFFDAVHFY